MSIGILDLDTVAASSASAELKRVLVDLEGLDEQLGANGTVISDGLMEMSRCLRDFIERTRYREVTSKMNVFDLGPEEDDSRLRPDGRTCKTGLEHIAALRQLEPYQTLLLGDSHFERFPRKVHGGEYFPLLENAGRRTFVAGVGGDSVCHLAWRLRHQSLLDYFTQPLDAIFILIGSNDFLKRPHPFNGDPVSVANAAVALLEHVRRHPASHGSFFVLLALPPTCQEHVEGAFEARRLYNAELQKKAKEVDVEFLDVFDTFGEAPYFTERGLFCKDDFHVSPNPPEKIATQRVPDSLGICV